MLAQMRNRSESREEFAYRVQISLFVAKLPLICFTHDNNQPSQLFTCSPLCWCWLGNGRRNEIFFLLALWGTAGVHTLDRQTDSQMGPSFQETRDRLACSWAVVLWQWSQEHVRLKAGHTAWFRVQGRKGEDLRKVWRTSSTEGFIQLPLPDLLFSPKPLLSNFS